MRFGFRRTITCYGTSGNCCRARWDGPVTNPSYGTGISLSGCQLEDSPTSGGEGGVLCWGIVPATGVHRDQPGDPEPGGGALLQQAGYGGAVDQGGEAGGQDDAALLPSVSLEPSAAGAEPAGLQPGKSVAASGFAERD